MGKVTLDRVLRALSLTEIPNGTPSREIHRFGNHSETYPTLCAVMLPFKGIEENGNTVGEFDIKFVVIEGELPFLVGLPSLLAKSAALNFRYKAIGINLGQRYVRMSLVHLDSHLLLPFAAVIKRHNRDRQGPTNGTDRQYTSCLIPSLDRKSDNASPLMHNGDFYVPAAELGDSNIIEPLVPTESGILNAGKYTPTRSDEGSDMLDQVSIHTYTPAYASNDLPAQSSVICSTTHNDAKGTEYRYRPSISKDDHALCDANLEVLIGN